MALAIGKFEHSTRPMRLSHHGEQFELQLDLVPRVPAVQPGPVLKASSPLKPVDRTTG